MTRIQLPGDAPALDALLRRSQIADPDIERRTRDIVESVRRDGDAAVVSATRRFDCEAFDAADIRVTDAEIAAAYDAVPAALVETIRRAAANIERFHAMQMPRTWLDVREDATLGQLVRPLDAVGIYVPGGRAAYPSSVLMNALPAKVAGVRRIAMATPPDRTGHADAGALVAAREAGVAEIYKVGGAQAIAALAYGTETIARVDKIVGPGNIYVANAKRLVFGQVGIDMVAGPSEVLVIADATARPAFVAADLLSQAEHDPLAACILVTDDAALADAVAAEIERQLASLPKRDIAAAAIRDHGAIVVTRTLAEAFDVANRIAPEHLELAIEDAFGALGLVRNAGAVFLGHWTPEPIGDYYAGPNHVLPTSGTARFSSPLGVEDFVKRTSVIRYAEAALRAAAEDVTRFARAEELEAHARAVEIRRAEG